MSRDAEQVAISALREATRAVAVGQDAVAGASPAPDGEPNVALEVAVLLEATARLVRQTDLDAVPRNGANHRLHAVVQHLSAGAELARRTEYPSSDTPDPDHPEARGQLPEVR